MNPSFYPKHLARQYAQGGASRSQTDLPLRMTNFERPWAQVYPLLGSENPNNNDTKYNELQQEQVLNQERQVQQMQTTQLTHRNATMSAQNSVSSNNICKKDATSGISKPHVPKNSAVFSGLPPAFIEAMKKLFDMVDVNGDGRVRLEDIADKWSPNSNDNDEHLPKGIVTSLKKVTMADGCLTFERFCAGLKIAILRHESEKKKSKHQKNNSSFDSTQTSESDSSGCSSVDQHNKNLLEQSSPASSSAATNIESSPSSDVASMLNRGMEMSGMRIDDGPDSEIDEEMQRISSESNNYNDDRLSRTNSLPNLQGMHSHPGKIGAQLEIGFHEDFIDELNPETRMQLPPNTNKMHFNTRRATRRTVTGPSPCPSEPSHPSAEMFPGTQLPFPFQPHPELGGVSSSTNIRRHQSQNIIPTGPPKPPRDPKRMSGHFMTSAYSTTSLPTATASNLPLSIPSSNKDHENAIKTQDNDTNKFLYKDTASTQSLSKENDPSIGNKEVVMRNRGGGPAHKRKELHHARRHTLQGGVDFSMIKRLRQWEEEKSVLEEGLKATKMAQDWYKTRLEGVSDRLRRGPEPSATPAANTEAMQERLMFELNSIRELNHRLARLMDLSGQKQYLSGGTTKGNCKDNLSNTNLDSAREAGIHPSYGFPTHMNLEIAKSQNLSSSSNHINNNTLLLERQVQRLKEQNRQLTSEVGQKSNQMTALEQEKRTLIKQLFQRSNSAATMNTHHSRLNNKKSNPGESTESHQKHLSDGNRRRGGSQSMGNIILPTNSQANNRNFESAKPTGRTSFIGASGPAIFKSASSLHQQQNQF